MYDSDDTLTLLAGGLVTVALIILLMFGVPWFVVNGMAPTPIPEEPALVMPTVVADTDNMDAVYLFE